MIFDCVYSASELNLLRLTVEWFITYKFLYHVRVKDLDIAHECTGNQRSKYRISNVKRTIYLI
jgi:hypothetical protein